MGVDTKGVVVTKVKDVMLVAYLAERALSKLLRQARAEQFPDVRGWPEHVREVFSPLHLDLMPESAMVGLNFRCFGEDRSIKLFFDCDVDHKDLGENSISFSMGCWGHSELFATAVLTAWSLLGAVYVDMNDSDADDMTPLETEGMTLLHAIALDYVSPYQAENIVEKFEAGLLPVEQPFDKFVGIGKEQWLALLSERECQARWRGIEAVAEKMYPCDSPALLGLANPVAIAA